MIEPRWSVKRAARETKPPAVRLASLAATRLAPTRPDLPSQTSPAAPCHAKCADARAVVSTNSPGRKRKIAGSVKRGRVGGASRDAGAFDQPIAHGWELKRALDE